jgi:hypothetical protein
MISFADLGIIVTSPGDVVKDDNLYDGTPFEEALAIALYLKKQFGDERELDTLRKKWPEAVETALPDAERWLIEKEAADRNLPDSVPLAYA